MTIPEDIRATAYELADQWISRGHHDNAALAEDIAEALMAERERCAKIADDYAAESWGMTGEESAAMNIAAAIRSPDKTETP